MLEYDAMSDDNRVDYKKYDSNLAFQAEIKLMIMRHILKKLGKDQILGHKTLSEEYQKYIDKEMTVDECEFIIGLFERYPEMSDKKLALKYLLEGEYSPWL